MNEDSTDLIDRYFELDKVKRFQFSQLKALYLFWNEQINVISRKDIDQLYERHVLHSLSIAKVISFTPGTRVLDIGTGGGFPGIPLAVLFPETHFVLTDSKAKKIKVVKAVAESLKLNNVEAHHLRSEKTPGRFDFAVSRAVTDLKTQWNWIEPKLSGKNKNAVLNGFFALKGGDLSEEIDASGLFCHTHNISDFFEEPFFETKKVLFVPKR